MDVFFHDADSYLDYTKAWSSILADGETIAASEWIVPDGLIGNTASFDLTTATIWIRLAVGARIGTYVVTNRVTTSAGRIYDSSMTIYVKQL